MTTEMIAQYDEAIKMALHQFFTEAEIGTDYAITGSKALEAYGLIPKRNTPEMDVAVRLNRIELDFAAIIPRIIKLLIIYVYKGEGCITWDQVKSSSTGETDSFALYHNSNPYKDLYKIDFLYYKGPLDRIGFYHTPAAVFKGKHLCKTQKGKHARDLTSALDVLTNAYLYGA